MSTCDICPPRAASPLGILCRDPPLKCNAARTRHCEEVAVPGGLGGIGSQAPVRAVVVDELFKVGEEAHWSVSTTDQPSFK